MVVKLKELYNTKYFYITLGKDLTYLFSTCSQLRRDPSQEVNAGNDQIKQVYDCFRASAPVSFDLADCKFTSDVTRILMTAQRDYQLDFIDTKDTWRNDIFKENKNRFLTRESLQSTTVELPELRQDEKALDFIRSLSKDVTYSVPVTYVSDIWVQLCTLISIFRPSIKLYLNDREAILLNFVAARLTLNDLEPYHEFYMVTEQGVQIVDTNNPLYVQGIGECDLSEAMAVANFVPTDFGRVVLKDVLVFRTIANECINTLNHYKNTRPVFLSELFK